MTYEEMTEYIASIPKFTKKNNLTHTRRLMQMLGNPDRRFEVIHVAGSNGKGSVCSMLNQVLVTAGRRTGLFVSPHLINIEERFQINGENCSREDFMEAFLKVKEAVQELVKEGLPHPSYFEFLFAMGMCIFAEKHVEYAVIETGLGGRLDATNVVEEPLITIITSISLEHTEYLGDTIEQIAAEKAGIIKEGSAVVFDGSNVTASEVIRAKAREMHAPFYEVSPTQCTEISCDGKGIDFSYQCRYDGNTGIRIPFVAEYQVMNAAVAVKAAELLQAEAEFDFDTILKGVATCRWPGRMQEISDGIYFDGAHNPAGIEAFLDTVEKIGGADPILLFSIMKDKDYERVIKSLCRFQWAQIVITRIPGYRGIDAKILESEFEKYHISTVFIQEPADAYRYAKSIKKQEQKLFCAGSLYLIGELEEITGGKK